jgi:signal transduction histidine kinase
VTPFRSVGARLALALLAVVTGALLIVYLIVVPSYRSSLANSKLAALERSIRLLVPDVPAQPLLRQQFASGMAPKVNARVVVFQLQSTSPPLLEPFADSSGASDSSDLENDPVALHAIRADTLAHGIVTHSGESYAEAAYPIGSSVLMLQSSFHDQLEVISVIQRRVFEAGAVAMVFAVLLGYAGARLFARRIRRLELAADRIAGGNFDEPVVDYSSDELGELARSFERMRLRLSTLDRARGEFIANASHELRTPLFALAGFLELLDDGQLDEATRTEFQAQMREQVERLTRLATDLLDLSRLDAGRLQAAVDPVDLAALVDELAAEFGPRARRDRHVLEVAAGPPVTALGDVQRAARVGRALVENALVHTPPGTTVRLSTALEGRRALLIVADDGPGIPPASRARVFERFSRLDGGRASGSGLGLAIARQLAELMDGRIELDADAAWTRFSLVLPVATEPLEVSVDSVT